jgi:excinuclease UvrABC nuclease subunit
MQLLYVGKSATLGPRLNNYFRWSTGKESPCRIVHTVWKKRPMFVATIAVTESFEAAALEEYLIAKVHPEENYLSKASPDSSSASFGLPL